MEPTALPLATIPQVNAVTVYLGATPPNMGKTEASAILDRRHLGQLNVFDDGLTAALTKMRTAAAQGLPASEILAVPFQRSNAYRELTITMEDLGDTESSTKTTDHFRVSVKNGAIVLACSEITRRERVVGRKSKWHQNPRLWAAEWIDARWELARLQHEQWPPASAS